MPCTAPKDNCFASYHNHNHDNHHHHHHNHYQHNHHQRLDTDHCLAALQRITALRRETIGPMSCPALHFTTLFGIGDPDVNGHKVLRMKGIMMFLVREHNRVAAELVDLHPMWDDEKLFLEVMMMMCLLHPIGVAI